MFKKTRHRIMMLIMAIATVVIVLMLVVIYVANSRNSFERSMSLLESYTQDSYGKLPPENMHGELSPEALREDGSSEDMPDGGMMPGHFDFGPGMKDKHNKMFKLSTFYSVRYDGEGHVVKVDCDDGSLYTEEEILEITDSILSKGTERGKYNKMPFLVSHDNGDTLVVLIDNTMEIDNSDRLFVNSLIVGISTWMVILILSWIFSKKIVQPLEQNDLKQKQFISDAGHELKTPISVISANADILSMEIGDNKWLDNILYENERMGILVKQLLELVRAENQMQAKEQLDFSRLVSGGALPFESVAFEHGLELNTEIEDGIEVWGNQSQLSQLISIFIDNAIEHSKDGREILVKLHAKKNQAVFTVVNAGPPIPEEVRARLFERFYQVDEARTEEKGHYGLGLAIAKAVAVAHNGKIGVECENGQIAFSFSITKI